jgi:hypothetical protein
MKNIILANAIYVFHLFIVLFVLLAPFLGYINLLLLHIVFSVSLLVHWVGNSNDCSLTLLEQSLRDLPHKSQCFTHQFIAPIYDISMSDWSKILYVITVSLLLISIYRFINHPRYQSFRECIEKTNWFSKEFFSCFRLIFEM